MTPQRQLILDVVASMRGHISVDQVYRQVARMLAKVLRGAKPAELPVEQPATFELAINLETAKAMGLTVPMTLLTRADKVI